jgi:hypothetical protein
VKKTYTQIEYETPDGRYWLATSLTGNDRVWIQCEKVHLTDIDEEGVAIEIPVSVLQEMTKDLCLLNKPVEEEIPF